MTPEEFAELKAISRRVRSASGVMGYCPWETAVYENDPRGTPRACWLMDVERLGILMAAELDDSPITPEVITQMGFSKTEGSVFWADGTCEVRARSNREWYCWGLGPVQIFTNIGQLRTELRQHAMRLARQQGEK